MRLKLHIEPVPASAWGLSLANRLPSKEWNELRQKVYRDANYKCEICGASKRTLHCHEVWTTDDRKKIRHLFKLECCCDLCHDVHHFGRTKVTKSKDKKYLEECIKHWCKVNHKTMGDFLLYEKEIYALNRKRADRQYIVKVGRKILV